MNSYALGTYPGPDGKPVPSLVAGDRLAPLAAFGLPGTDDMIAFLEAWPENEDRLPGAARKLANGEIASVPLAGLRPSAPVMPRQIFCTGANYRKHVIGLILGDPSMRGDSEKDITDPDELRRRAEAMMDQRAKAALPYCFVKLPSCVVGAEDDVVLPNNVVKPDWELELAVVIGRRARHVKAAEAMNYIAGYAIANDVTAREHIFRRDGSALGGDWISGKCFPTFFPFGPHIVPRACVADPYDLNIRLAVNGKIYQDETTADMMINIERQIEFLSDRLVLLPGDVISTGSPAGNGSHFGVFLKPGDVMEGSITGLGQQRNRCIAEE